MWRKKMQEKDKQAACSCIQLIWVIGAITTGMRESFVMGRAETMELQCLMRIVKKRDGQVRWLSGIRSEPEAEKTTGAVERRNLLEIFRICVVKEANNEENKWNEPFVVTVIMSLKG